MNDPMTAYNMAQSIARQMEKSFPGTHGAVAKLRIEKFNDVRSATDLLNVIVDAVEAAFLSDRELTEGDVLKTEELADEFGWGRV